MQMALKQFTKELNNPNSPIAKKFNTMLYGDPNNPDDEGLFGKFTDGSQFDDATEENIQNELSRYKRSTGQAIADNVLQGLGTAAKGAGSAWNAYHGLLGDALLASSQAAQSPGYANPFVMVPTIAAGRKAAGQVGGIIGDTIGTILQDVGQDIKSEREKEREVELLLRQHPSGQFYDARRKLTK